MDPDHHHHIDTLLERYLHLLHEYTSLREQLGALQASMYQDIARANFAAERGQRFGQDHYDERMQASRRLAITLDPHDHDHDHEALPRFTTFSTRDTGTGDEESEEGARRETMTPRRDRDRDRDPLAWFGLLAPLPLRQAQARSVRAVAHVVPRLAEVSAEMAHVEIEVRRARKRRAKMEREKEKEQEVAGDGVGSGLGTVAVEEEEGRRRREGVVA
ncbi:hypothetical protein F4775DRAFT_175658 [Biscogniauxia sp. FL1348]|nr:hypothetical protein F4775DRAFT_175658 [Biscogniauxia sp. FL1348]